MADADIPITAGSGTKVDTRTVGAGTDEHRQVVVIGDPSTASDVAPVTAANGLKVDVTKIIPGTGATNLGKAEDDAHASGDVGIMIMGVIEYTGAGASGDYAPITLDTGGMQRVRTHKDALKVEVTSSGLTTTATAYAAGDQLGAQMTIANAARVSDGTGVITGVSLVSAADTIGSIDVMFFESSVTLASDNAAFAISDADALQYLFNLQLIGPFDIGNNRICQSHGIYLPYRCAGGTSLYAALISRSAIAGTPFAAGTDIQLNVFLERN